MTFYTYILKSQSTGRFYCGSTNDIEQRLKQHNDPHHHATKTTKRFEGPWILVWEKAHSSRSEAMALERKIKKRGIKRYLSENGGC
jgi:putative endonuclease